MAIPPRSSAERRAQRCEIERLMGDRHARKDMLAGLFSNYFTTPATIRCELDDHVVHLNPRDRTITPAILSKGHWNRDELEHAVSILQEHGALRERGVFFDVGANIGTQTIYAMRSGAFAGAHAFEPAPDNIRLFTRNMEENDLSTSVRLIEAGVSDACGHAMLHFHPDNHGAHSLVPAVPERMTGSADVPITTLAAHLDYSELAPANIGLVWIDVEGHEAAVVTGATPLLEARIPVVFEFLDGNRADPATSGMLEVLKAHYTHMSCLQDETCTVHDVAGLVTSMPEGDYLVFAPDS